MAAFDPAEALRLIEAERITLIHGFDTHFKELLEHPTRPARDLSSLRTGILPAGMHVDRADRAAGSGAAADRSPATA